MKKTLTLVVALLICTLPSLVDATKTTETEETKPKHLDAASYTGLQLRHIGPALSSGRIADLAVHPDEPSTYYVAAASGGVWKTINNGTTWTPVFDDQGAYSIGCVTIDPSNPQIVWVGTGENNSQRSVSFGDGVYRSLDGGENWQKMGLGDSEHIGMIAVDSRDSNVVWVAAQGPLWRAGDDRGLYKTTDGGATWEKVLEISEHTGINEVHLDPRDSDLAYASSYQRRRRVWTLINGGPESSLHKTTDGGKTWREINQGLPKVELGRIGLAVSPANPDVLYAIVEAAQGKGGFFRSTDRGETWHRRSDHYSGSAQYYHEIVADPNVVGRVYSLETWMRVTEDGGKSFSKIGSKYRHVDDHAMWIDPRDTDHLLVGCDGGVYESWDRGDTYDYKENLSLAQFYRVGIDNSEPFYFVYGGTQDNATLGGPSRTTSNAGITNEDWFITVFGDGFQTRVDPEDPMIVYSESQYGGLARHDRRSGEIVDIQPVEPPGEEPYRFNWDAPLIISPHSHTRLYFAASVLFRSDDRGSSWQVISGDLSRGIDRNTLPIMGKVWGPDAVAKSASTSIYGNAVALTESPLAEGLLYVGTDDGQVHITPDSGATWTVVGSFPGVPEMAYVSRLEASLHDADTVYAAFDNHKNGDFKPYLLKSTDRGASWTSVAGDLPDREIVWALAEDHVMADLLFAGTEFGLYFSRDGGKKWVQLEGGLPTIAVRDLAIQRRENDLVLATFGRGFYILDDYSPLRTADLATLEREATLFPVKDALTYIEASRLGLSLDKAFQGDTFFTAPNPPFGAVFTYHLDEKLMTRAERRRKAEKEAEEAGEAITYPSLDQLRAEDHEAEPVVVLEVADSSGTVISRLSGCREAGFHRVAWDLRYPPLTPTTLKEKEPAPWSTRPMGPLALPGTYSATLSKVVDGETTRLAGPVDFQVKPLDLATFPAEDREAVLAFRTRVADLQRAVSGALKVAGETEKRLEYLTKALRDTPGADQDLLAELNSIESDLNALLLELRGDRSAAKRNEPAATSISSRVGQVIYGQWHVTSAPTKTQEDNYRYAGEAFSGVLGQLRTLVQESLAAVEQAVEAAGGPWTPGRFPEWEMH